MVSILEQPADWLENRTCTHILTNGRAPIRGTSQVLMEDFHAQASMRGGTNKSHLQGSSPKESACDSRARRSYSWAWTVSFICLFQFSSHVEWSNGSEFTSLLWTCRNNVWMKTPERNLCLQRSKGWLEFQYCGEIGMLQIQKASCLVLG